MAPEKINDSQIRLLVVDDAPFIREIVRHLCEKNGISLVGEACDGKEAVKMAEELKPDVILMDIIMPKMSGIEATKEIIARGVPTKVIAFSTADQDTMVMRAIDAGCASYCVKPFKGDELIAAIHKTLGR